jgi:hypothetical protein
MTRPIDLFPFAAFREQELLAAANKPLFSKPSRSSRDIESYPYVFDSSLTARQSGAYVGGCKVIIFFLSLSFS